MINVRNQSEPGPDHSEPARTPRDIDRFEDEGGPGSEDARGQRGVSTPTARMEVVGPDVASPTDPNGPQSMTSKFREQLKECICTIDRRGWSVAGNPEVIAIPCELDIDQLHAIQSLIGECNDRRFCGAEPGCLTLFGRERRGNGERGPYPVTVQFAYTASPRHEIKSADPSPCPAAAGGRRNRVQNGADFAANLP